MPEQPTREQFDLAAKHVMATAPPGLSREQFFALIDKEMQKGQSTSTSLPAMMRGDALNRAGISEQAKPGDAIEGQEHEPDTFTGGFLRSLKKQFITPNLLRTMAPIADPQEVGSHPGRSIALLGLPNMKAIPSDEPLIQEVPSRITQATREELANTRNLGSAGQEPLRSVVPRVWRNLKAGADEERHTILDRYVPRRAPNVVPEAPTHGPSPALEPHPMPEPTPEGLDHLMPNQSGPVQPGVEAGELPQSSDSIVQSLLDQHMPNQPGDIQPGIEQGELPQHPESPFDRYMPNQPGDIQPGVETGEVPQSQESITQSLLDRFMPNQSGEVQAGVESELPQHPESLLDRHMPNQSSEVQPGVEQGEMPQSQDSITQSLLDRFMPNQHGEIQPGVMDSDVSDIAASTAEPQQLSLAEALRGQVGSKDAARSLGMKAKDIKEIAPEASGLPTEVRTRLDAAFDALPTAEAKIKYAESAPNNLAREYLLKKLAGAQ